MYFKKINCENSIEILVAPANLVTFSGTVLSAGVTVNEEGRKIVLAGTLVDKDGNVVKQTDYLDSETLTTTPVGVLYTTVDVTDGDMPCSLVVEGYLRADRVFDGFVEESIQSIKAALPNIIFR